MGGRIIQPDSFHKFGDNASRDKDTVYQAEVDGFVEAGNSLDNNWIHGITDQSNPPTTKVAQGGGSRPPSVTFLVNKGDYYKVTTESGSLSFYYFKPLQRVFTE